MAARLPGFAAFNYTPPYDGSARDYYRFATVAHYIFLFSFFGHLAFCFVFLALGATVLAVYNVASCAAFLTAMRINRRGHHSAAFYLGAVEVVVHSSLCAFLIGWETGFHYFILGTIPFAVMLPRASRVHRAALGSLLFVVYGVVYFASQRVPLLYRLSPQLVIVMNYINLVITFAAFSLLVHYLARASSEAERRVEEASRTDYLTGALNRRGMMEHLEDARSSSRRFKRPWTVMLGDLDDFKHINDNYGHSCGDGVLVETTRRLQEALREEDVVSRWGGEEFLILLPGTDAAGARIVGERLLQRLRSHRFNCDSLELAVTITFGIAAFRGDERVEELIARADGALYYGKQTGKDRLVCDEQADEKRDDLSGSIRR